VGYAVPTRAGSWAAAQKGTKNTHIFIEELVVALCFALAAAPAALAAAAACLLLLLLLLSSSGRNAATATSSRYMCNACALHVLHEDAVNSEYHHHLAHQAACANQPRHSLRLS
jgi:hypothetical protein